MSDSLGTLEALGASSLNYAHLTLSGSDPELNVFDVDSNALSHATEITLSVPTSSAALINVRGAQVALQNMQVTIHGFPRSSLLWNFPEAAELVLSSISLPGSVLAPAAHATVNNGNLEGTLVAQSVHGSMEFHDFPLSAWEAFGGSALGRHLRLQPRGRLRAGCEYTLIVDAFPLNDAGDCLEEPFHQSFLVADGMESNFDREVAARRFAGTPRIPTYFKAKSGINTLVGETFERYQETLRLRDGLDSLHLEGTPAPSPLVPGQELSRFRQFYGGVPVYGHGYLVHEEGGLFRSAVGKLRPSIEISTEPTLSAEAAIEAALTALDLASRPWEADPCIPPPTTELMLRLPPGEPDLVLVWRVDLSGIPEADYADVTASDGTLVTVRSDVANITECTDFDPLLTTLDHHEERTITVPFDNVTSLEVDDLAIGVWSQAGSLFEAFNVTEPLPFRTESQRLEPEPGLTEFVCWGSDEETSRVARAHWATLNAGHTFSEYFDWHGLDGDGVTPLTVTMLEIPEDMPDESWPISSALYNNDRVVVVPRSLFPGTIAHEYAHGVVEHLRTGIDFPPLERGGEVGAIEEAFADTIGALAVHRADPEGTVNPWCVTLTGEHCDRNISEPEASNDSFEDGDPVQRPDTYLGPNWRPVGGTCGLGNDYCEVHHNSTVASHWFYTLTQGRSGETANDLGCSVEVLPLATSFDLSLFYASNALFASLGLIEPNAGLLDLRGMTSLVAQDVFGSAAMRVTMERAWHAVGVGPGPTPEAFSPLDGATDVEPWATELRFSVAPEDSGPWVLRYADNPEFEDATVVDITETVVVDGITYAHVYATLNAGSEYFWQAREGTTGSADGWAQCSPFTASFTTSQKPIHLTIPHRKSKSGYYLTNNMGQVAWEPVRNAGNYQALLREEPDGCERPDSDWTDIPLNLWRALNPEVFLGQTVDQNLVLDREPIYLWADTDLAPNTTYHLFVRAVSASGGRGTCSHFEVRKIQLEPFQKVSPLDFVTVPYGSGGPLIWTPSGGAQHYEVVVRNFQLEEGWQEVSREVLEADGLEVNDDDQIALTLGDESTTSIPGQMTWHVTAVHESGDRRGAWDPGVPDYRTDANFWNGPEAILATVTEDGTNAPSEEGESPTVVNLAFLDGDDRETQTCFDPGDNTAGVLWALYPAGTTEVNLEDFQDLHVDPESDDDFPVCTPRYELVDDVTFLVAYPYSNLIHEAPTALGDPTVLLLQVRTCGGEGHECCDDGTCVDGLVCDEGICADVECGGLNEPCCADQQCPDMATRWVCHENKCVKCGSIGTECCVEGDPCNDVSACHEGRCRCGVDGAPSCDSGNPSSGGCATPNTTRQGGSCEPVLPCGTPVPYAGANTPEAYEIEMGASQGSAVLWFNTYNVADNLHVYYEGDFLFDSDCVGTNYTVAGCYQDFLFNVLTCCDGAGWCNMSFAYGPGSSTNLTVEVEPNCSGTPDTAWEFRVECPD